MKASQLYYLLWTLGYLASDVQGSAVSIPSSSDTSALACFQALQFHDFDDCSSASCLCTNNKFLGTWLKCIDLQSNETQSVEFDRMIEVCNQDGGVDLTRDQLSEINSNSQELESPVDSTAVHIEARKSKKKKKKNRSPAELKARARTKQMHSVFSGIMAGTIVLLMIWGTICHFCFVCCSKILKKFDGKVSRTLRKRLLLAPMFNKKHSAPATINKFTLNLPTRTLSVFMIILIIENIIFLSVGYHSSPDQNAKNGATRTLLNYIGARTGIIVVILMPFLWLFGGRNNFFLWLTGWPLDAFNVLHKWIGRLIMVNLFVHGIAYTWSIAMRHSYSEHWAEGYYIWGNIGFFAGLIIFVQGMHYLRQMRYDLFLGIHIFLACIFIAGAFWHIHEITHVECVYACIAIWGFDRLGRVLRILWSGPKSKADIKVYPDNIIKIDFDYSKRWKFYPGCYGFIHFLGMNRFWQNHPFTFIHHPSDPTKLQVFARVKEGITKRLAEKVGEQMTMTTWIDGPYGSQHPVHKYDNACFFAGGIGITGTYTYIQDLVNNDKNATYTFVWVVSDVRVVNWFGDHLKHLLQDERIEVQLWYSNSSGSSINSPDTSMDSDKASNSDKEKTVAIGNETDVVMESLESFDNFSFERGIPPIRDIVMSKSQELGGRNLGVVSCGPGAMNDDVRLAVADTMDTSTGRVDYFEESFSW